MMVYIHKELVIVTVAVVMVAVAVLVIAELFLFFLKIFFVLFCFSLHFSLRYEKVKAAKRGVCTREVFS